MNQTNQTAIPERLPAGVEHIVAALCEDYPRREREIKNGALPPAVMAEYLRLNALVDDALEESCEPEFRVAMRQDIAERRGAHFTQIWQISEGTYKARKKMSKLAIARRMRLI